MRRASQSVAPSPPIRKPSQAISNCASMASKRTTPFSNSAKSDPTCCITKAQRLVLLPLRHRRHLYQRCPRATISDSITLCHFGLRLMIAGHNLAHLGLGRRARRISITSPPPISRTGQLTYSFFLEDRCALPHQIPFSLASGRGAFILAMRYRNRAN